ncbi:MAG: tetratricopeptide repeat protein, partial [Planctomycetota bacterium]
MNFRFRHLAFFTLGVLVLAVLLFPKPRERALWEKRGGDLGRIIDRHRRSLKDRPEDVLLNRELASFLIEVTSFDEAKSILEGQIARGQEPVLAARVLGQMHENLGDLKRANDYRIIASRADPLNTTLLFFAVKRLMWMQDEGRAIDLMQNALAAGLVPTEEFCQLLAQAYENKGRLNDALVWRQRLTVLKPRSLRAWLDLADINQLLGYQGPELAIRRSIWEKTSDIEHGLFYASRLDECNLDKQLQEFLASLLVIRPNDITIRRFIAATVIKSRDMEKRQSVDDYISQWGKSDYVLRYDYATWLYEVGDPGASATFDSLLTDAGDQLAPEYRAKALGNLGRYRESADLWEQQIEFHPMDARVELIDLCIKLGRLDQAVGHARALWSLSPTLDRGLALIDLLVATGRVPEALTFLNDIEERHGFVQEVTARRALLAAESRLEAEAQTAATELEKRGVFPATVLFVRAKLLHDAGKNAEAETLLSHGQVRGVSSDAMMTSGQIDSLRCFNALSWAEAPKSLVGRLVSAQELADPADFVVPFSHVQWLQNAGFREEAEAKATLLLSRLENPVRPEERIMRARMFGLIGRRTDSIREWESLRQERPLEALTALVELREADGDIAGALRDSTDLVELDGSRYVLRRHASLLARNGRNKEAADWLGQLIQKNPGDKSLILDALWVHLEAGLFAEAEPVLQAYEAVEKGPAPSLFRAAFALRLQHHAQAVATLKPLDESLLEEGCPEFGGARDVSYTACTALIGAKDVTTPLFGMTLTDLVIRHLKKFPSDATLALTLATLEREAGRPESALACLEAALEHLGSVSDDSARLERARILTDMGRPEAVSAWEPLVAKYPEAALPALVSIHRNAKRWEEAVVCQQELVELRPTRDNLTSLAFLLDEAGQKEASIAVWQKLIRENKGDTEAARFLVYSLLDSGDSARALGVMDTYLEAVPDDEAMRILQCQVLVGAGSLREALASLSALPSIVLDSSRWSPALSTPESLRLVVDVFISQAPEDVEASLDFEPKAVLALRQLPPEDAVWRYRYALWLAARGRQEESESLLAEVLEGPAVSSE